MFDVTALGEVLIDFACQDSDEKGYPYLKANPGGAPCNFLAALSRYGAKTAMIGKVGQDAFGDMLMRTLEQIGVETRGVIQDPRVFTTLAFVTFNGQGEREFSFARKPGADICLEEQELDLDLIRDSRVFHFGTLSLTDEPARSATQRAVAYAKEQGCLITYDPNLREPLWEDLDEAREQILWGLAQADIVKISEEETEFLWGISPEEAAKRILRDYGVKLVFVTLGGAGCYYASSRGAGQVAGPQVHPIDTTGAGDIFGGSAVSQILKTGKKPEDLTDGELRTITAFAVTAASLSTETLGGLGSVPDEARVRAMMPQS